MKFEICNFPMPAQTWAWHPRRATDTPRVNQRVKLRRLQGILYAVSNPEQPVTDLPPVSSSPPDSGERSRAAVPEQRVMAALDEVFGFREFRPNQREIIAAILARRDVFAVMPTGGGKSLCYQLPAHLMEGTGLVVSPLISLMKDQVDAAKANGLQAEFLNSSLDSSERSRIGRLLARGELDLLYVAPERLAMDWFLPMLKAVPLSLIAVDEAHCISEWGHDFRKDYLTLDRLVTEFPNVPLAAFTATATHHVQQDIIKKLGLRNPFVLRASFDRPNLFYQVIPKSDELGQILRLVRGYGEDSGIVYRTKRKDVEETAAYLQSKKIKALPYHAGLDNDIRKHHQEMFNRDEANVIVATIAFGMGIDKSNIRYVIHGDLPKNIEGYYQETGRSGRDGEPAQCVLLFGYGDLRILRYFIDQVEDAQQREVQKGKLRSMIEYAESHTCRRTRILKYFGEKYAFPDCDGCDVCVPDARKIDATRQAQIVMSAVARTAEQSDAQHVIDIVVGKATDAVRQLGHDQLKTFGVGKDTGEPDWRQVIGALLARGCLRLRGVPGKLLLSDRGKDVLFGRRKFEVFQSSAEEPGAEGQAEAPAEIAKPARPARRKRPRPTEDSGDIPADAFEPTEEYDLQLFEELRGLRKRLAQQKNLPPFVIFSDRTLRELAGRTPTSLPGMRKITGVGDTKLRQYGPDFVAAIAQYLVRNPHRGASPF